MALPGGASVQIRPVRPDDVDGLLSLFGRLGAEDRYRRFFSSYHPSRRFVERMTTLSERGGVALVATVRAEEAEEAEEVVGEASCSLLPGGNAELGITVDRRWRGWLGPSLLDALLEAAAARGIGNVEAEVLAVNGPMLKLARSRGAVVTGRPEASVVRVVMGADSSTPTWSDDHDRPRLLVELTEGWGGRAAAERAGLRVIACPGPAGRARPCPALAGAPCPLARDADAIVLPRTSGRAAGGADALLAAHQRLHPGVPVCVEAPARPDLEDLHGAAEVGGVTEVVGLVQRLARAGDAPAGVGPSSGTDRGSALLKEVKTQRKASGESREETKGGAEG